MSIIMFSGDGREGVNSTKHRAQYCMQLLKHDLGDFL